MSKRKVKFALVGIAGFVCDSAIFSLVYYLTQELMISRLIAFWLAATTTWYGNRHFTFQAGHQPPLAQWGKHMVSCHVSGCANLMLFYAATTVMPVNISFVLGILLGMVLNYLFSSVLVYSNKQARIS